jgi:hypothetical protein
MLAILIALVLLAAAVGAIYLILKNMGEEGVEIAAPGSCKSGRCGVRCAPGNETQVEQENEPLDDAERRKEAAYRTIASRDENDVKGCR